MSRQSKVSIVRRFALGYGLELNASQEKRAVSFISYNEDGAPVINHESMVNYLVSLGGFRPGDAVEADEAEEAPLEEVAVCEAEEAPLEEVAVCEDEETRPLCAYYNMPSFGATNAKLTLETLEGVEVTSRRKIQKSVAGNFVHYMASWAPGERHSLMDLELDTKPELTTQIVRRIRSWFGKGAVSLTEEGIQVNLRLPK